MGRALTRLVPNGAATQSHLPQVRLRRLYRRWARAVGVSGGLNQRHPVICGGACVCASALCIVSVVSCQRCSSVMLVRFCTSVLCALLVVHLAAYVACSCAAGPARRPAVVPVLRVARYAVLHSPCFASCRSNIGDAITCPMMHRVPSPACLNLGMIESQVVLHLESREERRAGNNLCLLGPGQAPGALQWIVITRLRLISNPVENVCFGAMMSGFRIVARLLASRKRQPRLASIYNKHMILAAQLTQTQSCTNEACVLLNMDVGTYGAGTRRHTVAKAMQKPSEPMLK